MGDMAHPAYCAHQGSSEDFTQHLPDKSCWPRLRLAGLADSAAAWHFSHGDATSTLKHRLPEAGQNVAISTLQLEHFPDSLWQRKSGNLAPSSPKTLKHPEEWCRIPESPGV